MRVATYYLANGREVDIFRNDNATFTAKDAFLHEQEAFFDEFPTWYEVSVKWQEFDGKD